MKPRYKLLLLLSVVPFAVTGLKGQSLKELFGELGKTIQKKVDEKVTEKVENPCIEQERTAQVEEVNREKAGTWVLETTGGRVFQLSTLAFGGQAEDGKPISDYLSLAQSAQFSLVDQSRFTKVYRVHITYAAALEEGRGGFAGLLAGAVNETTQKRAKNDFRIETGRIEGTALDDKAWCLNVPTNTIRSFWIVPERK